MSKNTICLWYDKDAETAARFYAATFPDSAVDAVHLSLYTHLTLPTIRLV
jgi:predicted 3-demethylubiquinone-9 3-methyltransferase (glyoxalase superfamily)